MKYDTIKKTKSYILTRLKPKLIWISLTEIRYSWQLSRISNIYFSWALVQFNNRILNYLKVLFKSMLRIVLKRNTAFCWFFLQGDRAFGLGLGLEVIWVACLYHFWCLVETLVNLKCIENLKKIRTTNCHLKQKQT